MVRIIFMEPPAYMPVSLQDFDGLYSLDLGEETTIALTRIIDDYIDIGRIKQDTFKEFDIPVTNKNSLLLEQVGNPSALNENNNKTFKIQLLKDDFSYPVEGLQLQSATDLNYSIVLNGEINNWYRPLSNLYLNEIELGSETIDYVWINARHNDNYIYSDTSYPVFAPLVNYGQWFIECNLEGNPATSQVVFENWRFWYSPLAVLRQAFCQAGYKLIAPFLETEYFRRAWTYLLDPEFETANQGDVANRPFQIEATGPLSNIFEVIFFQYSSGASQRGVLLFTDVVSDPGTHTFFNVPSGMSTDRYYGSFYSGGIIGNFQFNATVRLKIPSGTLIPVAPNFVTLRVLIKKSYKFGVIDQDDFLSKATTLASQEFIFKTFFVGGINVDNLIDLNTSSIKVYKHELVFVQVELVANLVDGGGAEFTETVFYDESQVLPTATFKNNVEKQVIEEGDTLDFGLMMRKDLTAIDLFSGVAHLPNFKIETDSIAKEVRIYPEFKIDLYSFGLQEGFFKDNTDDPFEATPKIEAKSMRQTFKNVNLQREIYLKFQNSSDGFITRQFLEDELHSKRIDLGPNYADGTNVIENPLFEPLDTAEDPQLGLQFSGYKTVNWIPFMWESEPTEEDEYPSIGYRYTPRIAIAYPLATNNNFDPSLTGQDNLALSAFVYEDSPQTFYNLFGQIFPEGITIVRLGFPDSSPDLGIIYGNGVNPNIQDFYDLVYSRSINQAYFNLGLEFLVKIDLVDFSNLSFRRKWHVKYKSGNWGEIDFYARLSRVADYAIGEDLTTPVQLVPDNNNFENC